MPWLLITTPVTTLLTVWYLHALGVTGWPLVFSSGLIQVALGAAFARLAGRDWRIGARWAAGSYVPVAIVVVWYAFQLEL